MKIIVIIVTYNGMKWYKNCFDSLRNSTIPLDTIVIDNKSLDGTVDFIKTNYPEIYLVESDQNLGFGKANNIGFRYAIEQNADYVFLLNQDAWIKPNTIEILVNKMIENPEYGILSPVHLNGKEDKVDFAFPAYIQPDRCPNLISDYIINGKPDDKVYEVLFINAALWLISRKCLDKIGGFLPIYSHYGEDEDYTSRMIYHGFKRGIYPYTYAIHDRQPSDSSVSFTKKRQRELIKILIVLTNINQPLFKCYYRSYFELFTNTLRGLFLFDIKTVTINFINSWKILYYLPQLYRERKLSKLGNRCFISQNK